MAVQQWIIIATIIINLIFSWLDATISELGSWGLYMSLQWYSRKCYQHLKFEELTILLHWKNCTVTQRGFWTLNKLLSGPGGVTWLILQKRWNSEYELSLVEKSPAAPSVTNTWRVGIPLLPPLKFRHSLSWRAAALYLQTGRMYFPFKYTVWNFGQQERDYPSWNLNIIGSRFTVTAVSGIIFRCFVCRSTCVPGLCVWVSVLSVK